MFRITKDHLWHEGDSLPSRVGEEGHETASTIWEPAEELPHEGLKLVKFKLWDDDGELYYEGELHDDDECINQMTALTWGEVDAGCTTIKVRRADGWKQEIA